MHRRTLLKGIGGLAVAPFSALAQEPGLRELAAAKGLMFGAAIAPSQRGASLRDPAFAALLRRECNIFVPENAMKWEATERAQGQFTFGDADTVAAFARDAGAALRGHTLLWHISLPAWVEPALRAGNAEAIVTRHVTEVAARYKGRIHSWDVINEAVVDGNPQRADSLRITPFLSALGPAYFDVAFHAARAADPSALLAYNDYNLEHDVPFIAAKRLAVLRLLEGLRQRNVPIGALGIQAHLSADRGFDARGYARFLSDVAQLGLKIMVTELDVDDNALPSDLAVRDARCADLVRAFLDATLANKACLAVLTWGIADHLSFANEPSRPKRRDGLPHRPLPLDDKFARKPMWQAIARAFEGAPAR